MKYTKVLITTAVFIVLSLCMGTRAYGGAPGESPSFRVEAKSALLLEPETGRVLFEQNADERLAPASVTKVMTIYLIYDAIDNGRVRMEDIVTISPHAAGMGGSQIFLEPTEKQTLRDLLKAVIISSANDAAVALAEFISGSEESFVDLMNRTAKEMGLENSHFVNACGLDAEGHYMSARDLAVLTKELINKHPQVFEYSTVWMDTITHTTARGQTEFGLTNTNKLIKWYNGATGLKTGSTGQALYCLSGTATRDNMSLVAVVLAAPNPTVRFQEVMKMLDYGFSNYRLVTGYEPGKILGMVKVGKGETEAVPVKVDSRVSAVVPKGGAGDVAPEQVMEEYVSAPVKSGQKLGEVTYSYGGQVIGKSDIVAADDVDRASLGDTIKKLSIMWFE